MVGTQGLPDSIDRTLRANRAHRALEPHFQQCGVTDIDNQQGLVERSGLTPQPYRPQTTVGGFEIPNIRNLSIPSWLGADVRGDERCRGPIYNYARVFTWWQFVNSVEEAFDATIENINAARACRIQQKIDQVRIERNQAKKEQIEEVQTEELSNEELSNEELPNKQVIRQIGRASCR